MFFESQVLFKLSFFDFDPMFLTIGFTGDWKIMIALFDIIEDGNFLYCVVSSQVALIFILNWFLRLLSKGWQSTRHEQIQSAWLFKQLYFLRSSKINDNRVSGSLEVLNYVSETRFGVMTSS